MGSFAVKCPQTEAMTRGAMVRVFDNDNPMSLITEPRDLEVSFDCACSIWHELLLNSTRHILMVCGLHELYR